MRMMPEYEIFVFSFFGDAENFMCGNVGKTLHAIIINFQTPSWETLI